MKIVILKKDEMIIKQKEYIDMLIKISKLEEQASPFHKYSMNEIREMLGFPKINDKGCEINER